MSAPDTNVPKQVRQHRWPLIGMIVVVAAALIGIAAWLMWEADQAPPTAALAASTEEAPATGAITPPGAADGVTEPQAAPLAPAPNP